MDVLELNGLTDADMRPRDRMGDAEDALIELAEMGVASDGRIDALEDALVELAAIVAGGE